MKRLPLTALALSLLWLPGAPEKAEALTPPTDPSRELQLLLRHPAAKSRILLVTAHPDDEDAGLLAWLRYHEGVETTLMTLTHGEGGQNEIGPELHAALGVLRSRELQAAAAYTGVEQRFSSGAEDFGYSFSVEETLERWRRPLILRELVETIRSRQPVVVLTLPMQGNGGGQHHQASARLTLEACRLAADPDYPESSLAPFTVRRVFEAIWDDDSSPDNVCAVDLSEYDAVLGGSYVEIGAWSRSQHKCQGMAAPYPPHPQGTSRWNFVWSSDPQGDPPRPLSLFWSGLPAPAVPWGKFTWAPPQATDALETHLLALWDALPDRPGDVNVAIARRRAARALELVSHLDFTARATAARVRPGAMLTVAAAIRPTLGSGSVEVALEGSAVMPPNPPVLSLSSAGSLAGTLNVILETPPPLGSKPGWAQLWARPTLHLRGRTLPLPRRPVRVQEVDAAFPGFRWTTPQVVPDPSVRFREPAIPYLALNQNPARADVVVLVSTLSPDTVQVSLIVPEGMHVTPATATVITESGVEQDVHFELSGALDHPDSLTARAEGRAGRFSFRGYRRIAYPHIWGTVYVETARVRIEPIDVAAPPVRVGYVAGTGDRIPEALERLGLPVQALSSQDLRGDLSGFDTIVTGVRAYKVRNDLKAAGPELRRWMESGGHLVVMYNKMEFNHGEEDSPYAPYPGCRVTHDRITDETAPVTALLPDHPLLNAPNPLGPEDWEGWVQERGLYFLRVTGSAYRELLRMEDPFPNNAGPKTGALVWAPVGKGSWTYMGLGLFRELPQGVPGAYRLLANAVCRRAGS